MNITFLGAARSVTGSAARSVSPAEVIETLARHVGRSAETIRYTLKNFDEAHADIAIFSAHAGRLRQAKKSEPRQVIISRNISGEMSGRF